MNHSQILRQTFNSLRVTTALAILAGIGVGVLISLLAQWHPQESTAYAIIAMMVAASIPCLIVTTTIIVSRAKKDVEMILTIFNALSEAPMIGAWVFIPSRDITIFSSHLQKDLGVPGSSIEILLNAFHEADPHGGHKAVSAWRSLLETSTPFNIELQIKTSDGTKKWFRWSGRACRDKKNKITTRNSIFYGSLTCTDDVKAIEDLVNDIALLSVESPNPIFRMTANGRIEIANKSATPFLESLNVKQGGYLPEGLLQIIAPAFEVEEKFEMEFASGEKLFSTLFVPHINKGYVNAYCTDVTERAKINRALEDSRRQLQELHEKTKYMAQHDNLTDLPNRGLFEDRLKVAIERTRRYRQRTALILVDLDHFKDINDTMGHDAGDAVLVETARRLTSCVRGSDTVARLGGDEFAVLLQDLQDESNALAIGEKIISAMAPPLSYKGRAIPIGLSLGIAFHPGDASEGPDLYKNADVALYEAKRSGRNRFSVFGGR